MVLWAFPFIASNGRVVASPITVAPAAFPDSMPDNESSKTKQFSGLTPMAFAPRRYGCGCGLENETVKPAVFDRFDEDTAMIPFYQGNMCRGSWAALNPLLCGQSRAHLLETPCQHLPKIQYICFRCQSELRQDRIIRQFSLCK